MDTWQSQLTLVEPPPAHIAESSGELQPSTILVWDRNSFLHSNIRRAGQSHTLYTMDMTSNYSKKTLTKPTSDVPFVSITRVGGILPAQVSFNGEPSYKLSKWLKEEPKPPKSSRTMPKLVPHVDYRNRSLTLLLYSPLSFEIDGEKYIWITNFVGQEAVRACAARRIAKYLD